jgi:NagD protein
MDGVLVREEPLIQGAERFIQALQDGGRRFLPLTNSSLYTPRDLTARLPASGLHVAEGAIWTAALATARSQAEQRPGGSALRESVRLDGTPWQRRPGLLVDRQAAAVRSR